MTDLEPRHLGGADAQPVQGLDRVHERGELMAKKTMPDAEERCQKDVMAGRPAARHIEPARRAADQASRMGPIRLA